MIMDFVAAIVDRSRADEMVEVYSGHGMPLVLSMLGKGTATSEHLSLYGLEATEKALVAHCRLRGHDKAAHKKRQTALFIDIPGNGIMLAVPGKKRGRRAHLGISDRQRRT